MFVRSRGFESLKGFEGNQRRQLQLLCIFRVSMTSIHDLYIPLHSISRVSEYTPIYLVKQTPEKLERKKLK